MVSARLRELLGLLPVGLLVTAGFTAVLISRTSQVSNLSLIYGAVFLDEAFTLRALVGLALILGGVAGVTGALRLPKKLRREPPVP